MAALQDGPTEQAHWHTTALPATRPLPPAADYPCLTPGEWGARLDADLGVERDAPRLERLIQDLPEPGACATVPEQPVVTLAARAALLRTESRGAHYRADAPQTDPAWQGRILWRRGRAPQFEEVES
jgi:aspartate oxidase